MNRLEYHQRLGYAIAAATDGLPENWELTIAVERHSGIAVLRDPLGGEIDEGEIHGDTLAETIENAVAHARAMDLESI